MPTPLNQYREPDLSFIRGDGGAAHVCVRAGFESGEHTYPGTTEEVLRPLIEQRGFAVGVDFFLVYSPEREDHNAHFNTATIPKVMGGSEACSEVGVALYEAISEVVAVSSTCGVKHRRYRAVNIGDGGAGRSRSNGNRPV